MNNIETYCGNAIEVMHLLEEILDGFTDEYCRPSSQIALYKKYLQLRQTDNAKLVRHLIVIPGGRVSKPIPPKQHSAKKADAFAGTHNVVRGVTSAKQLP